MNLSFDGNLQEQVMIPLTVSLPDHYPTFRDEECGGVDSRCSFWGARVIIADQFRAYGDANTPMVVPIPYHAFIGDLYIHVKSRARPIYATPANEEAAIGTLREMISESDYRKYITHGFILVRGDSGRVYQISRHNRHIKVWNKGVLEEEICVRIDDREVPPTDHVIAFKAIVECSEEEIHHLGNVYKMAKAA